LVQVDRSTGSGHHPWPGLTYDEYVRPRDADPGDAPRFGPPGGAGHFQNADVRLDPDVIPFGGGDEALVAAWLRPLAGEPIDAAWLVAMCDVLPPAVFSRTTGPVKAATLEYLVHLATGEPAVAAGDHVYLSCDHRCPVTASPWRTPRCGVPTAESLQSLDRPASPARRRCNAPNDRRS
jgi:hypothetical protein